MMSIPCSRIIVAAAGVNLVDRKLIEIADSAIKSVSEAIYEHPTCRAVLRDAALQFLAWLDSAQTDQPRPEKTSVAVPELSVETLLRSDDAGTTASAPPPPRRETQPMRLRLGDQEI